MIYHQTALYRLKLVCSPLAIYNVYYFRHAAMIYTWISYSPPKSYLTAAYMYLFGVHPSVTTTDTYNLTVDTFVRGSCNFELFIKPEGCLNFPFYTVTVHVNNLKVS